MPVWTETLAADTARRIIPNNPFRLAYTVRNDSASSVYIGRNRDLATSGYKQGMLLTASGGSVSDDDWKGEVWAISGSAVNITVIEDVEGVIDPAQPKTLKG